MSEYLWQNWQNDQKSFANTRAICLKVSKLTFLTVLQPPWSLTKQRVRVIFWSGNCTGYPLTMPAAGKIDGRISLLHSPEAEK